MRINGPTKFYLFTIRSSLDLWSDLGWCDSFQKQKGEAMRCDVCGKKSRKGTGIVFYENDSVIANYHRHCYRGSSFWKKPSKPLNVNKGLMNASKLATTDLRKGK